jgi:MFS family permease
MQHLDVRRSNRPRRILCHVSSAPNRLLRDGWLVQVCVARSLMMLVSMSYAAALPLLRTAWDMSGTAAGSIATSSQLGYAISLMLFSWLADRIGARRVFMLSGVASAVTAMAFALFARSYLSALVLYTLVSVSAGGTYTTMIMLFADRYPPARRGAAVGWFIASMSLGYALSLALTGLTLPLGGYPLAFLVTSAGSVVGMAIAALALRGTPNVIHPRREGHAFGTEVLKNRETMLLVAGYTAHSWELLGMWVWAPAFLATSFALSGSQALDAVQLGAYAAASFSLMGLVAAASMGRLSDRLGRRAVLIACAGVSTLCSFTWGWMVAWPAVAVLIVGAIYGFCALGDSPVLSTAVTETVKPAYLGSALALRSLLGFGAGAIAPLAFGAILDATNPARTTATQWGWSFVALGVGGVIATACAWALARDRTT